MGWIRRNLLVAAALAGVMWAAGPALAQNAAIPPVTAADRSIGRADAPVTVVEYASFSCHHCANWHMFVYPQFKTRYIDTGQVRLVFRNLPTAPEQMSLPAAGLARCARPERFFDVASVLMRGQGAVLAGGPQEVWFEAAIEASGRTRAQIEACLALPATRAAIQSDIDGARAAGVQSTPSLFINGQPVHDRTLGGLEIALRPLLTGR